MTRVGQSLLAIIVVTLVLPLSASAYNPPPGEWTGWLVLDPWGSMYLYNHCYVYPVSQDIVPKLKKYAGKPCVIAVKKTFEISTPGPVRIEEAEYDRPARFGELKALSLVASVATPKADGLNPTLTLKVKNKTKQKARFVAAQLTVVVLVRGKSNLFTATNGHSYPHNLYGGGLWIGSLDIVQETGRVRVINRTWYHTLDPGEEYTCTVELKLSPGEYYVWGGYGESNFFGPTSLMSNGVRFEVPESVGGGEEKKGAEQAIRELNRQIESFNSIRPQNMGVSPIDQRISRVEHNPEKREIRCFDKNGNLFLVLRKQPNGRFKGTLKIEYHELVKPDGHSWGHVLAHFYLGKEPF